jgi:hypothetical protein
VNSAFRPRARRHHPSIPLVSGGAGWPEAAFPFLDAVESSVEQLLGMPNMGAPKPLRKPALDGLRSWPVQGFEDVRIYYLVSGASRDFEGGPHPARKARHQPSS